MIRKRAPEHKFQKQVATFLNMSLPSDSFWTSIDHAGGGILAGANRKGRGVVAGIPDIMILWASKAYFIELKAPEGRVSADQRIVATLLTRAGAKVGLAYDLNDVQQWLDEWRIPLSARIDPRSITGARVIA